MIDEARFKICARTQLDGVAKLTGAFDYFDVRGERRTAYGHVYLQDGLSQPAPLLYAAGYEFPDDEYAFLRPGFDVGGYLERGWVVVNPQDPKPGEAWPGENPLPRSVNLDIALLHIARAQPFIDDARVMITGTSAGGWMTFMLAAESFPLAGVAPDIGTLNLAHNIAFFHLNEAVCAGPLPGDGRTPAVPGIVMAGAPLARQAIAAFGDDFSDPRWLAPSPVAHADEITCPLSAYYSTADVLTPWDEASHDTYPYDTAAFPAGFRLTAQDLGVPDVRLCDVMPALEIVRVPVPTDAPPHDIEWIFAERRELAEAVPIVLPHPSRQSMCVVDEGPPGPRCDHFRHRMKADRSAFWDQVSSESLEPAQLTAPKLALLLSRYRGQEWIASGLRHLDDRDAERADVLRGIETYRRQGEAHEARFQELYGALAPELQVLEGI